MSRFLNTLLITLGIGCVCLQSVPLSAEPVPNACSLVSTEEVKKHLPWPSALDQFPAEEQPIGDYGSSCSYPSVMIQLLPSTSGILDVARKRGGGEAVSGIGSEAYFYNNADEYAELYVRTGKHVFTLQADVSDSIASVKPGVLGLGRALAGRLE